MRTPQKLKLTPEKVKEMLRLYKENNLSMRNIAKIIGVSTSTVDINIPKELRKNTYKLSDQVRHQIFCLFNIDKKTISEISKLLNISPVSARKYAGAYDKYNMKGEIL